MSYTTEENVKELKKVSDSLEEAITSAHKGLRTGTATRCQRARTLIQEAISELLEAD